MCLPLFTINVEIFISLSGPGLNQLDDSAWKGLRIKTAVLITSPLLCIRFSIISAAQSWWVVVSNDLSLSFLFFFRQGFDKHPFPRSRLSARPATDITDSCTWPKASHWTCKEPGNVSLLLTKQSLLWSCNRKPWAETSTGLAVRNPHTFSREGQNEKWRAVLIYACANSWDYSAVTIRHLSDYFYL